MTQDAPKPAKRSAIDRFLNIVEKGGNALPHPVTLFAIMAVAVVVLSWIASQFSLAVAHPVSGEEIRPVNLMTVEGLHRIMDGLITNFTGFAPLGTVLVALIGIGVAEHSGLIGAALRLLVLSAPRRLLTFVVVFAGIMSNMAAEIGYVLLVPLSGLIFIAAGRHPILGMAAAFAGVSGGYSANLLLGTIDPLLAGLSQEAARIIDPDYTVNPAANWWFMIASTPLIALLGTVVTEKVVAKRFPAPPESAGDGEQIDRMHPEEKRGLLFAALATLALTALVLLGTVPADGFLRGPDGDLLKSPFLRGVVALIFTYGVVTGIAYGIGARTIRSDADVIRGMSKSMETLATYLVLTFFAAQFVAFFNWTQLGLIFAVEGATFLKAVDLPAVPLFIAFILLTALANLFMGSASAKWALMAPVFVPMFMLLGYSPELTQIGYRIGDSVTNIISPMMSYFALIIAFLQRYEPKAGIGTVVATMLPYSIAFLIGWTVLFTIWMLAGWPIGPDAPLNYIPAG
ncbi:AbgT family transporter [Lysobacter alkalisoli]|uniref:AbgT family transporter n=2 Tax=Marilutibacter alkalisoli TaxID=2591633 RepID=A0A514BWI1_9GAMM|nr:AbgT family transporter [Lysobacter alkalisoli]